jgi:hypothetical protein
MATAGETRTTGPTQHKLGKKPPRGWQSISSYAVELRYDLDSNGDPVFSYRDGPLDGASLLGEAINDKAFSEYLTPAQLKQQLDLVVLENCSIIIKLDDDENMYWTKGIPAIYTKNRYRPSLYFSLRYVYHGVSYEEADRPDSPCKQISFGAAVNQDMGDRYHSFGLNVTLENSNGDMIDVPIDPDIRNPGLVFVP